MCPDGIEILAMKECAKSSEEEEYEYAGMEEEKNEINCARRAVDLCGHSVARCTFHFPLRPHQHLGRLGSLVMML